AGWRGDYNSAAKTFSGSERKIMNKTARLGAAATVIALAGCATAPPNANRVNVVDGASAFTANCKMLGPVSERVNAWKFGSEQEAWQQVVWNMQAQAFERYGADTLSIQRRGLSFTEMGGEGVAL